MRRDGEAERDVTVLLGADAWPVMLRRWPCLQLQTAGPQARIVARHRCPPAAVSPCSSRCKKPADLSSRGSVNRLLEAGNYRRSMEKEMLFIQKANMGGTAT